jgi:hypothetical protein
MVKIIQGIILSLLLSLVLVTNASADDEQEKEQGINDAMKSDLSIHQAYLKCYALLKPDKLKCSENIISKNKAKLSQNLLSSNIYITSFAYEAERLGFLWFLQNEKLHCDAIDEGPSYNYKREAYEVLCRNGNKYYMRFDYSENLWHLKND